MNEQLIEDIHSIIPRWQDIHQVEPGPNVRCILVVMERYIYPSCSGRIVKNLKMCRKRDGYWFNLDGTYFNLEMKNGKREFFRYWIAVSMPDEIEDMIDT